jgi:hypothetical protein
VNSSLAKRHFVLVRVHPIGYVENVFSLNLVIIICVCSQLASNKLKNVVYSSGDVFLQAFNLIGYWILNNVA